MDKVLVAVDGSDRSIEAAHRAANILEEKDIEITVITVMQQATGTVYDIPHGTTSAMTTETMENLREEQEEMAKEKGERIVKKAATFYRELGMDVKEVIRFGSPADIICDYAEANDMDMIVLADKGHGGVKRYLLGSISDKVVRHANTSVLVIK